MMTLGVAHGLSRYKLKFSAEKVDIMIINRLNLSPVSELIQTFSSSKLLFKKLKVVWLDWIYSA
jgi:hypothetical protein